MTGNETPPEGRRSRGRVTVFLFAAGILGSTLTLGWIAGILFWHLRITSALRSWESNFDSPPSPLSRQDDLPESEILTEAGCRALPEMVKTLNRSTSRAFQERLMSHLVMILVLQNPPDQRFQLLEEYESRWAFRAHNLELEQRSRMEEFNAWWESHHHEYHRWWRFWTARCRPLERS